MAKRINWDFIKPLYRAGNLSNREICRQYAEAHQGQEEWKPTITETSIRNKAKKDPEGWAKNLAGRVKEQVKENLVRSEVRSANLEKSGLSDDEIVHQVAEIGSGVIKRHRDEIKALIEHENRLLEKLGNLKKEDKTSLKDQALILKNITAVRAQRIVLERQAYNLDDDTENTGPKKIIIKRKTRDGEDD